MSIHTSATTSTTSVPGTHARTASRPTSRSNGMAAAAAGMVAAAVMAMFAMVASVTYQQHGFFTPLLHMSALFGSPDAMMRSVAEAADGSRFWLAGGPALSGLAIHMVTSAMFGVAFALLARTLPRPGQGDARTLIVAGTAFGVATSFVSAFVGLPVAARITGAGSTISDMASMAGWTTFVIEHALFGAVLGMLAWRRTRSAAAGGHNVDAASATLVG